MRLDHPVRPETTSRQLLIGEAAADGAFRHYDDGLLDPLVAERVQGDEHQRARRARGRRRLDQQVLLAAMRISPFLHHAHGRSVRQNLRHFIPARVLLGAKVRAVKQFLQTQNLDLLLGGMPNHMDMLPHHGVADLA